MEVSYGIGVTNRYALFYDENEDPLDALKAVNPKSETTTAIKTAAATTTAEKKTAIDTKPTSDKQAQDVKGKTVAQPVAAKKGPKETQPTTFDQNRPREDGQSRGGMTRPFRGGRGGFPNNGPREERNNRRNDGQDRPPRDFGSMAPAEGGSPGNGGPDGEYRPRNSFRGTFRGGREGGRGRGGTGIGGAGRGGRGGKREFDRQSGSDKSGVKPQEKREGSGAHNWGSVKDEIEGQMEPAAAEEAPEVDAEAGPAQPTETKEEESVAVPAVPVDEEPVEYTLDEWKAKHGERKKPEFNIRKPGEGEDNSQWKKTFVLEKKKEEEEEEEEPIDVLAEYPQRVGRQKFLDIEIRFADSRSRGSGGGRGGRGAGRGSGEGGFRGGFRGGDREAGEGGYRAPREGGFRGERGGEGGGFRGERGGEGVGFRGERGGEGGGFRGERGGEGGGFRGDRGGEGGGFRGNRGGEGGGYRGGRGSSRGTYANRGPAVALAPKVDDEKDFPALG